MEKSKYAKGIYYNERRENAPADLIGATVFKKQAFLEWFDQQEPDENGYVKLDMWKGEYQGKPTVSFVLNTYSLAQLKKEASESSKKLNNGVDYSDVPF